MEVFKLAILGAESGCGVVCVVKSCPNLIQFFLRRMSVNLAEIIDKWCNNECIFREFRIMLENLKLFLMIVEKGTLSAAGRELGLSPASVSERLMMLESYYKTRFLARTTRSLSLTEEGKFSR
ncbi:hypothetical protein ERHA55_53610 (plasmid) [Erwinia rhapontici]|nr:hypothetical protein ERHA55_53610 [Erwinia rhapontici]